MTIQQNSKTTTLEVMSDSVRGFFDYLTKNENIEYASTISHKVDEDRWSGTYDWEEYEQVLANGDNETIQKIKETTKKYSDSLAKKYDLTNSYKLDVTGKFFDIGMVMSGEPEAWLEDNQEDDKPLIELTIAGSYSANVSKDTLIDGASRVIAIIDGLEKQGYSVRVDMKFGMKKVWIRKRTKMLVGFTIKDYKDGVNYKKLSSLIHPSMLRRGIFRLQEIISATKKFNLNDGRGQPENEPTWIRLDSSVSIDTLEDKLIKGDENV